MEHAAFVTHPAPLVVQVESAAEQAESVLRVAGNKEQVILTHAFKIVLHAQVTFDDPKIGTLLH